MSIEWIPTKSMRKILPKEQGNRGLFPSSKVPNGIIEYESCLERDFYLICQHSPEIIKFQHQPITISYYDTNGKERKYTPDVYLEFNDGKKYLIEIKYESEIDEKRQFYEERWKNANEWAKQRQILFTLLNERRIRSARWYNVWFTLGSSKIPLHNSYISKLLQLIPEKGEYYNQLCYLLAEQEGLTLNKSAQILCYAIYHGLVFIDSFSTKPLSNNSIVRLKKGNSISVFKSLKDELNLEEMQFDAYKGGNYIDKNTSIQTNLPFKFSSTIPEKYETLIQMKTSIIKAWLKQAKPNRNQKWRELFCKKWDVTERTLYNWISAYQKEGIAGLIPRHQKSGRRKSFSTQILNLMEQARQIYLKPMTTLKYSYNELGRLCKEQDLQLPPEAAFRTFIYSNTSAVDFAKKRGRSYLKTNFTPALTSFQGAIAPMQIVQIDNTSFDVFPVDSEFRKTLSTPNMTAAIDCYSRMVTGFNLSFFPNSSRSVLEILVQTILPKENYVNTFNSQQGWPIQGFPVLILVDNGMDFRSEAIKQFCIEYDIILEYAPIRTPRYKAFIEQWFNIIHKALVSESVAGVRPLLKQRLENPQLKPDLEAILTLQELEDWVHKWVLDEYHFTNPYNDHAPAPYLRWQDFQDGHTNIILPLPREPPSDKFEIDRLYLSKLERLERNITYQGVVWEHLKFNNKELSHLYSCIGNKKVEILLDSRDIRTVWVLHSNLDHPICVGLASGWAQTIANVYGDKPIHASAWKKDINLLKDTLKVRISPYLFQQELSRIKRDDLLRNARKNTKRTRKEVEKNKETIRNPITPHISSTYPLNDGLQIPPKDNLLADLNLNQVSDNVIVPGFDTDWEIVKKKLKWSTKPNKKAKDEMK